MSEIRVESISSDTFRVTVKEGVSQTEHEVRLTDAYHQKLTQGKLSKEKCVEGAFRFLLEREPKELILTQFDMTLISRYFGEFESACLKYMTS